MCILFVICPGTPCALFLHSFTSTNAGSEHSGHLYPVVKCKFEHDNDGVPVVVEVLDADCTCMAKEGKCCWHIAGLLYIAEEQERPFGSLVPESSTSGDNMWHSSNADKPTKFNRRSPLAAMPSINNKRKFEASSPTKNKDGNSRKSRAQKFGGDSGRFAGTWASVNLGVSDLLLRNDLDIIALREKLYAALRDHYQIPTAAENEWPAKVMPDDYYKVIPIVDPDYLQGSYQVN